MSLPHLQKIGNGRLKLMDILLKVKSITAVWIKRFLHLLTYTWKAAPQSF